MLKRITLSAGLLLAVMVGCRRGEKPEAESKPEPVKKEYMELYEHVQKVMKEAEGTPGQEPINYLRTGDWGESLETLKSGRGLSDYLMRVVKDQTDAGEKGITWPRPPVARIPYAWRTPVIDGRLDDRAWKTALTYTATYEFNLKEEVENVQTTWRILWDSKYLYFAFDCVDADLISPKIERDGHVYNNDCVEIFILPDFRFRTYWELIIGPSGSIYDSIQCKNYDTWGCNSRTAESIEGLKMDIKLDGTLNKSDDTDKGYTVEVAVPFAQLPGYSRARPAAGQTLNFMLVRLDRNSTGETDKQGKPKTQFKCYSYQPLLSWGHNIWNHAKMELIK